VSLFETLSALHLVHENTAVHAGPQDGMQSNAMNLQPPSVLAAAGRRARLQQVIKVGIGAAHEGLLDGGLHGRAALRPQGRRAPAGRRAVRQRARVAPACAAAVAPAAAASAPAPAAAAAAGRLQQRQDVLQVQVLHWVREPGHLRARWGSGLGYRVGFIKAVSPAGDSASSRLAPRRAMASAMLAQRVDAGPGASTAS